MKIKIDDKRLRYTGRIDWSKKNECTWVYPATSLQFKFSGKYLNVKIKNKSQYWDNYFGCIADGRQHSFLLSNDGEATYKIPVDKKREIHEVLLFKRQDSCHEMSLLEIEISDDATLLELPERSERRMEFYGDSVSAGEVVEATDYTGKEDPAHNGEFSNSWYSYAWMTARNLNAEIHDIAQGGIALLDQTGYFQEPNAIGMENTWDKIHYNLELSDTSAWDFLKYDPQVVVVAIGQNDNHPYDYMAEDYDSDRSVHWREHYRQWLKKIRGQYKKATIICMTTLLYHDSAWDRAISEVVESMQDKKITKFTFLRNGCGTPGHPRISEQEEMAEELSKYIRQLEGWD